MHKLDTHFLITKRSGGSLVILFCMVFTWEIGYFFVVLVMCKMQLDCIEESSRKGEKRSHPIKCSLSFK